jgi:hypothetical protein
MDAGGCRCGRLPGLQDLPEWMALLDEDPGHT